MTGPHWKARTDELRANAAHVELVELRADNERWRIKFEASQLVAGKAIRERAEATATVDRQAARILALSHDITEVRKERGEYYDTLAVTRGMLNAARRHHDTAENDLADALAEIDRLQVELADARSPVLHRGTVLDAVPLTHDGIRSDKAIRPRGGTG